MSRISFFDGTGSFCFVAILLAGCSDAPPKIKAPSWDVDGIADAAMELCDEDKNGVLSKEELKKNSPGLAYASRNLDTNEDGVLSREEVRQRFQDYLDSKVGILGFTCFVVQKNGRPVPDGQIRLVPEPFLEEYIEVAQGGVVDPRSGAAEVSTPNDSGAFGVRAGMYRVEVTSPSMKIGKKYNEETILGVEVSPFTNPHEDPRGARFVVGK